MPNRDKPVEFTTWCLKSVTGDEKGQAQIFLHPHFQAFDRHDCLNRGRHGRFRVPKIGEDGDGVSLQEYLWKPVVLVEMKSSAGICGRILARPAKNNRTSGPNNWQEAENSEVRFS